jgi:threonine aldolase
MLLYAPKRPTADLPPVRVNLYSDTQTRPSPAMKDAMVRAEVGDEQHGDDPTVHELCDRMAALLGKEAAVFLPSGTMCNQIAILTHCRAGDEIIAHESAHIITNEGGGPGALTGATVLGLRGERGQFDVATLRDAFREKKRNVHCWRSSRPRISAAAPCGR